MICPCRGHADIKTSRTIARWFCGYMVVLFFHGWDVNRFLSQSNSDTTCVANIYPQRMMSWSNCLLPQALDNSLWFHYRTARRCSAEDKILQGQGHADRNVIKWTRSVVSWWCNDAAPALCRKAPMPYILRLAIDPWSIFVLRSIPLLSILIMN